MKLNKLLPVDLYNVGLFNLMLQKPRCHRHSQKSKEISGAANAGFKKASSTLLRPSCRSVKRPQGGKLALALRPAAEAGDAQKLLISYQQLSALSMEKDDKDNARKLLEEALKVAKQTRNKDAEKDINDRLRNIR